MSDTPVYPKPTVDFIAREIGGCIASFGMSHQVRAEIPNREKPDDPWVVRFVLDLGVVASGVVTPLGGVIASTPVGGVPDPPKGTDGLPPDAVAVQAYNEAVAPMRDIARVCVIVLMGQMLADLVARIRPQQPRGLHLAGQENGVDAVAAIRRLRGL